MTDRTLEELARRCEEATGPSIELDREIHDAVFRSPVVSDDEKERRQAAGETVFSGCVVWRGPLTASLDAALTLVPEGWALTMLETTDGDRRDHTGDPLANWQAALIEHKNTGYRVDQRGCWRQGFAATAALALCAAALRAREEDRG